MPFSFSFRSSASVASCAAAGVAASNAALAAAPSNELISFMSFSPPVRAAADACLGHQG
jgi:hypothetical protein